MKINLDQVRARISPRACRAARGRGRATDRGEGGGLAVPAAELYWRLSHPPFNKTTRIVGRLETTRWDNAISGIITITGRTEIISSFIPGTRNPRAAGGGGRGRERAAVAAIKCLYATRRPRSISLSPAIAQRPPLLRVNLQVTRELCERLRSERGQRA